MISILIAARNEEASIIKCLQSISDLHFPEGRFEVLIGNDASQDRTAALVEEFIDDKPNFRLFHIHHTIGLARGKANVLAQLIHQAAGDILCITDADVQVPPTWLSEMYAACRSNTGIATGITLVKGNRLFHQLQALDWVYASGIVKLFSDCQIPVTAMGNNMVLTRQAYQATGGYEHLPFSLTEDYVLFHAVVEKKYAFRYLLNKEVKAYTEPMPSLLSLLKQRKRWMAGAMQLPFYIKSIFFLYALFLPLLISIFLVLPALALTLLLIKLFADILYLLWVLYRIHEPGLLKYVLLYEVYLMIFSLSTLLYYFAGGRVEWKGRVYEAAKGNN